MADLGRRILRIAGLFVVLLAAHCDPVYYAELSTESIPRTPRFRLGTNPDFSGSVPAADITVSGMPLDPSSSPDSTRDVSTFWHVTADTAQESPRLSSITYGQLPYRFHEVSAAESLLVGYVYTAEFRCPGIWPAVRFLVDSSRNRGLSIREITLEEWLRRTGRHRVPPARLP